MSALAPLPREQIDYTWVLTLQLNRVAELSTELWKPGGLDRYKLRAVIGAVWTLYRMVRPIITRYKLPDYDVTLERLVAAMERERGLRNIWKKAMEILEEIVRALHAEGLLIRESRVLEA